MAELITKNEIDDLLSSLDGDDSSDESGRGKGSKRVNIGGKVFRGVNDIYSGFEEKYRSPILRNGGYILNPAETDALRTKKHAVWTLDEYIKRMNTINGMNSRFVGFET